MHQQGPMLLVCTDLFGDQRMVQAGCPTRVAAGGRQLLVGQQLRLDHHLDVPVDGLDLVADREDGSLGKRHQPGGAYPHRAPAR